ncbi:hypothetical protein MMC27_006804 [Xylographa pallens]|nr:hypothetical protein [Xylographa pallens]
MPTKPQVKYPPMISKQAKAAYKKSGPAGPTEWQAKAWARQNILLERAQRIRDKQVQARVNKQRRDKKKAKEMEERLKRGLLIVEQRYMSPRQTRVYSFFKAGGTTDGYGVREDVVDKADDDNDSADGDLEDDIDFDSDSQQDLTEQLLPKPSNLWSARFPKLLTRDARLSASTISYETTKKHARSSSPAFQDDYRMPKRRCPDFPESSPEMFFDEEEWPPSQRDARQYPASESLLAQLASFVDIPESNILGDSAYDKPTEADYPIQSTVRDNVPGYLHVAKTPSEQPEQYKVNNLNDLVEALVAEIYAEDADFDRDEEEIISLNSSYNHVKDVNRDNSSSKSDATRNNRMPVESNMVGKAITSTELTFAKKSDKSEDADIIKNDKNFEGAGIDSEPTPLQQILSRQQLADAERISAAIGYMTDDERLAETLGVSRIIDPNPVVELLPLPAEDVKQNKDTEDKLTEEDIAFMADILSGNRQPDQTTYNTTEDRNISVPKPLRKFETIQYIQSRKDAGVAAQIEFEKKDNLVAGGSAAKLDLNKGFDISEEKSFLLPQILSGNVKPGETKTLPALPQVLKPIKRPESSVIAMAPEIEQVQLCQYRISTKTQRQEGNYQVRPLTTMERMKSSRATSENQVNSRRGQLSVLHVAAQTHKALAKRLPDSLAPRKPLFSVLQPLALIIPTHVCLNTRKNDHVRQAQNTSNRVKESKKEKDSIVQGKENLSSEYDDLQWSTEDWKKLIETIDDGHLSSEIY